MLSFPLLVIELALMISSVLAQSLSVSIAPATSSSSTPTASGSTSAQSVSTATAVQSGGSSTNVSIPSTAIAGGISYTQPPPTQTALYYKIAQGSNITFGWNFTSLYVTPASLTFEARCSANGYTYPVGPTTGVPASDMSMIWDPYAYQQSPGAIPFAEASYTLRVFDERGKGAAPTAGYFFSDNTILRFGLYRPAAYTPLAAGWQCVGCSSAAKGLLSALIDSNVLVVTVVTAACLLIGSTTALYK